MLYTAPNYCDRYNNKAAILRIDIGLDGFHAIQVTMIQAYFRLFLIHTIIWNATSTFMDVYCCIQYAATPIITNLIV